MRWLCVKRLKQCLTLFSYRIYSHSDLQCRRLRGLTHEMEIEILKLTVLAKWITSCDCERKWQTVSGKGCVRNYVHFCCSYFYRWIDVSLVFYMDCAIVIVINNIIWNMTHISYLFGNKPFEEPSRNLHSPVSQNSLVHYVLHFHGRLVNCIITGVCFHIIAEMCWGRCNGYNIMCSLGGVFLL